MARFFRSPSDLAAWVKSLGAQKAATAIANIPKAGQSNLMDIAETTKRIAEAGDANAAETLFDLLKSAGVADNDVEKAEAAADHIQVANDLLQRKVISSDEHAQMVKQAQIMRQPGQYDMPLRICPKLPMSVGKKLISTYNCRHYCLDGIVLDDDPMRVYCGELLWRQHVAQKFSHEWQDRKTGEWVGGYINDRFYKFPDAGTPANKDVPRDGGNPMSLKPGERTRTPRPHQWSTERRMQEAREKNSTKDHTLGKTASSVGTTKTAFESVGPTEYDCPKCRKDGHGAVKVHKINGTVQDCDCQCPACASLWKSVTLSKGGYSRMAASGWLGRAVTAGANESFPPGKVDEQFNEADAREDINQPTESSCGCCTGGCICQQHSNAASGRVPQVCDYHKEHGKSGIAATAKTAQVDVENVGSTTHANGYLTKVIKGVEVELPWTMSSAETDEVEFEWPENMMMNVTPGQWDGDVCKPDTNELLLDGLERENFEGAWAQEVLDAVYSQSKQASTSVRIVEAKKGKSMNPWAVCHTTVDKDENPDKYERCVMDVKNKHPVKADEDIAREVLAQSDCMVKIASESSIAGEDMIAKAFSMAIDLQADGLSAEDAVLKVADATGLTVGKATVIREMAIQKMASHTGDAYVTDKKVKPQGPKAKPDAEVQQDAADLALTEE